MLIKIDQSEVKLGMFVHGFEGRWLSHPFWLTRFLLTKPRDLERIRQSDIEGVIIDARKGALPTPLVDRPQSPALARAAASPGRSRTTTTIKADYAAVPPSASQRAAAEKRATRAVIARSVESTRKIFEEVRLVGTIDSDTVVGVVDEIAANIQNNRSMLIDMTRLRDKDRYTYIHSVAVCALMVNVAFELGMDDDQIRMMGTAGFLHDIGKSTLDQALLTKPSPLTEAETWEMRRHVEAGHDLLLSIPDLATDALDACLHHHERLDGSGYPIGLSGTEIGIPARLAAICDVYDALTSERPYKHAWAPTTAIAELYGQSAQFDRHLLFSFMKSIGVFPPDMLVRMRSNQLGIVLAGRTAKSPTRVRIFWSIAERQSIEPYDVVPSQDLAGDQVVSREQPATWGIADWDATRALLLKPGRFGRRPAGR